MANLYGFGRLAWNPDLSAEDIADEWTRQTFGTDPQRRRHHRRHAAAHRGAPTKTTPARSASRRSPTSSAATTAPTSKPREEQRLGPVASRRRKGRRHGPHRRHRHRLHRAVPPAVAKMYEIARDHVPTSCCSSSTTFRTRTNCTPARPSSSTSTIPTTTAPHEAAEFVERMEIAARPHRRAALQRGARSASNTRPATRSSGATPSATTSSSKSGIADAQGRAGHYPESHRSRVHATPRLRIRRRHSMGERLARPSHRMHRAARLRRRHTNSPAQKGTTHIAILYFDLKNGDAKFRVLLNGLPIAKWTADRPTPRHKNRRRCRHTPHDRGCPSSPRRSNSPSKARPIATTRCARLHRDCPVILDMLLADV